jgi:hypothetical protein
VTSRTRGATSGDAMRGTAPTAAPMPDSGD